MIQETSKIGKRGAFVIPSSLRDRFGLEEGSVVIAEEREEGVLIRPAVVFPIEKYSKERKAELLLSNAINLDDYNRILVEIRAMGLDPESIPHEKPTA
ncbi:MAG: AbrB/MazE/SpoVT family DNA-binding domain-containing protein [bacterium]|nr:AbrB/MazE/SpoVT family DNA-binding domain-containing protein [bacterium]